MLEQLEDHAIVPRRSYPSERAHRATEAMNLFPANPDGDKAAIAVFELVERLHQTASKDIEGVFRSIRTIFQNFNISLDI